jgi:hypothetical protein
MTSFTAKFITAYLGALNNTLDVDFRQVINGMDNSDFYEDQTDISGTRTGFALPSALTPIFRSARDAPGDRYSWTRPPFGSASDLAAAGAWDSGFNTTLSAYSDDLGDTMTVASSSVFTPVQITGGFKLNTEPVVARQLTSQWSWGAEPHWLDRREPDFVYG